MQHLDHDRLVFLALGESEADHGETDHLGGCVTCRGELDTLRHVAGLGADTQGLHALPDPPAHLWAGILAELDTVAEVPALAEAHRQDLPEARPEPAPSAGGRPEAAPESSSPVRLSRTLAELAAAAVSAMSLSVSSTSAPAIAASGASAATPSTASATGTTTWAASAAASGVTVSAK